MDVFIGSYTVDTGGRGITRFHQDPETGALEPRGVAAELTNPTYLARHPTRPVLYAVGETADGSVHAFGVPRSGPLEPLGARPTGGADPCHVAVDAAGAWVVVANYGGGSVAVFPIGEDGGLGPRSDLVRHAGSGPVADRQEGPHAHMAQPWGEHLFVTDLGTDRVHTYAIDGAGRLREVDVLGTPPGTGPRHLAFGPDGRGLLVGELDSSLTVLAVDGGVLRQRTMRPATARPPAARNLPSAVRVSADGRFAYVGNRGTACVSVFALVGDEARAVDDVPAGGMQPRDVAFAGDFLYVANQDSGTVVAFRPDPATGVPEPTGAVVSVPAPACVLAAVGQ